MLHRIAILTLLGFMLGLPGAAFAKTQATQSDTVKIPTPQSDIADRTRQIIENVKPEDLPDYMTPKRKRLQEIANNILKATRDKIDSPKDVAINKARKALLGDTYNLDKLPEFDMGAKGEDEAGGKTQGADGQAYTIKVYATLGTNHHDRRQFIQKVEALVPYNHVKVLLRGLPEGMHSITDLMRFMVHTVRTIKGAPNVLLAPLQFRKENITAAPTVIYYRDGKSLARIEGSLEIAWLKRQVRQGKRGYLGQRGNVHNIAERNLMAVIKERWARVNPKKMRKKAINRFWSHFYSPTSLPQAEESKRFKVDPAYVVGRTIKTPRGKVIARKGEVVNPLEIKPFPGAIIAFNGDKPKQVRIANLLIEKARRAGLAPIIVVTQGLPGDEPSFKALNKLEGKITAQIFFLKDRLVQRFHLTALPAIVRADNGVFVVHQINPKHALRTWGPARNGDSHDAD